MTGSTLSSAKWKWGPMDALMVTADVAKKWDKANTTGISFGLSKIDADFTSASFTSPVSSITKENDDVHEWNLFHTIASKKNKLRLGWQAIYWHTPTGEYYYPGIEREEELYGYYLTNEYRVSDRLTLDAGARLDRKHITKGVNRYGGSGQRGTEMLYNVWAKDAVSYSLGASYKANDIYSFSTRLSYSRQPTDSFINTKNNKLLDDETRVKFEAGVIAKYSKAFNPTVTFFNYDIKNCKIKDPKTPIVIVNGVERALFDSTNLTRSGVEIGVQGELSKEISYKLGYSHITSTYSADNGYPNDALSLQLNYNHKDIAANITVKNVGDYESDSIVLGNYTVIDATVSKKIDKYSTISLYGRNLSNQKYATAYVGGYFYDVGRVVGIEFSRRY